MRTISLATLALLAACGGPADPPASPTNGAAAPPAGEPDNRIECRPAGAAAFARACTVESVENREGRVLTIRKADGGFRRLLIDRQGSIVAADGAEQATLTRTDETGAAPVEIEIGGDRFLLETRWVPPTPAPELNRQ
ncbi:MAG TPA: hypothetical protein VMG08_06680 [Allosphingosinicella sp.]|nr:hypothetical protein [Allosphingosinicella sp.]